VDTSHRERADTPSPRLARDVTPRELMVTCAAREIRDAELVFVGMRVPLLAFMLAKQTHAPRAVALFENGIVREHPARDLLYTMGDAPNLHGATQLADLQAVMSLLQQGRVDLGLLGGAQIDRHGNINSTRVQGGDGHAVRLPGSGGACDIACLARRTVLVIPHESHRLPERVDYLTSPGFGDGGDWRQRVGLPGGGPTAIVTDRAVMRFDPAGEARLASRHPGVTVASIRERTGWPLQVLGGVPEDEVPETEPPTALEINLLRTIDREGFWTGAAASHG
jgi:glutaconate CoA-transferase subunit B